jgi:3-oxoacyl-[acyl-carrier-protein] synthase II
MAATIVVTGLGSFSPLGVSAKDTWEALLAGESGARTLEQPWVEELGLPVTFAAQAHVEPDTVLDRIEAKRLDRGAQLALLAARDAWADAGSPDVDPTRLGVDWATGIGGVWTLLNAWDTLREKGPRRVLPLTVPMLMPNAPSAAISMEFKARAGARTSVSACASSTESIANAVEHLRRGDADVIIAGGTEASIHPLPLAAFAQMQALSKRNDDPHRASRPYDVDRDGFVIGEGAGALVLESLEHAQARGATVHAILAGVGITSDGYHITAPEPTGAGASAAIRAALADADLAPGDIAHVNAHSTSTPVGDIAEANAIRSAFGDAIDQIAVSATKSMTGHLLGAAGALEAIFTVLAVRDGVAPPTINLDSLDPQIVLDVVGKDPRTLPTGSRAAVSNAFGFGGHNVALAFRSVA